MILAGDIGGTKTNLGLFDVADGALKSRNQETFPSKRYSALESIVQEFITGTGHATVAAACFGVAGPVVEGRSVTPNLPWVIESMSLASRLNLDSVAPINDLEATAHGIAELNPEEFVAFNEGSPEIGNAALIAAGTGFGDSSAGNHEPQDGAAGNGPRRRQTRRAPALHLTT